MHNLKKGLAKQINEYQKARIGVERNNVEERVTQCMKCSLYKGAHGDEHHT
jgi:hypothetical protein